MDETITQKYKDLKNISNNKYTTVYKGINKETDTYVAIKEINKEIQYRNKFNFQSRRNERKYKIRKKYIL